MVNVRQATDKILEMVEEGILDKDTVIMSCLKYMSEDDVADMAHCNEFFLNEEDEDEDVHSHLDARDHHQIMKKGIVRPK